MFNQICMYYTSEHDYSYNHWLFKQNVYSLINHWIIIEYSLNDHWIIIEYSLNDQWLIIEYSLNNHWLIIDANLDILESDMRRLSWPCSSKRFRAWLIGISNLWFKKDIMSSWSISKAFERFIYEQSLSIMIISCKVMLGRT